MQKYFFDIATTSRVYHDFQGRVLSTLEQALTLAELIALDTACTAGDEFSGAEVQIRDVAGRLVQSVPVGALELIAA